MLRAAPAGKAPGQNDHVWPWVGRGWEPEVTRQLPVQQGIGGGGGVVGSLQSYPAVCRAQACFLLSLEGRCKEQECCSRDSAGH